MAEAEVGDEQSGRTRPSTGCRRWWRSCSARRPRSSCRPARCATRSPSRSTAVRATRSSARAGPSAALRGGRTRGHGRRGHASAAGRARHLHRRPGAPGASGRGCTTCPARRAVSVEQTAQHRGRCLLAARARSRRSARPAHEAGLACHMDGARLMNAVVASGTPARAFAAPFDSRLARPHQGARRAGRRGAGGLARVHRGGLGLQAALRRGDAPGGHHRGGRHLRARAPRRSAGGGSRAGAAAGARPGRAARHRRRRRPGRDQHRDLRRARHRADRRGVRAAHAERIRRPVHRPRAHRWLRAVFHLDVPADGVERALSAARAAMRG